MFDEIKNKLKKFNSYEEENLLLVNDDCFKVLKKMPKNSVDVYLQILHIFYLIMELLVVMEKWSP